MQKVSGSKPAGVQGKKRKKKVQGAWIIWRRRREKNGSRGRRESAKRQHAKARNEILFYSYSK